MKKMISFYLILLLLFAVCGCSPEEKSNSSNNMSIVVLPDEETKQTVNGYKDLSSEVSISENSSQGTVDLGIIIVNKKSKKYHLESCKYVSSISDKNLASFESVDRAIYEGYSPCAICFK